MVTATAGTTMPAAGTRIRFGLSLREGVMGAAGRREVEVVCIRPGLSRNGNFYGSECLRQALPLFEGARAYVDHSESPLRSVRDLAGSYRNARLGSHGEVRATLRISKSQDWLWELIEESVQECQDLVGLSIDVQAAVRDGEVAGRTARIVERITALHSVDVITKASAGGAFEKILEADKQSWWDQMEPLNEEAAGLAQAGVESGIPVSAQQQPVWAGQVNPVQLGPSIGQAIPGGEIQLGGTYVAQSVRGLSGTPMMGGEAPSTVAPVAPPPQIAARSQLQEGQGGGSAAHEAAQGSLAPAAGGGVSSALHDGEQADATRLLEEVRHERAVLASERLVDRMVRGSELPGPVRARLERRFAGQVVREADLAAAIDEERSVLAELTSSGLIRGMGYEKSIRITMTEGERLQKAFDQLFDIQEGETVPRLSGIREAYVASTHDLEISGVTAPDRLREADTTTATFSFLLGTSMNKRLLKDYQACPYVPIPNSDVRPVVWMLAAKWLTVLIMLAVAVLKWYQYAGQ
jgi:hypothetical protein